jgi:hypothetical protein
VGGGALGTLYASRPQAGGEGCLRPFFGAQPLADFLVKYRAKSPMILTQFAAYEAIGLR